MAAPSAKELEVLTQFRKRVSDVEEELPMHFRTDILMLSWLRARNLNLNQAEEMLRKSIEWRKVHDIYNLHQWSPPENYLTDFYFEICGWTPEGLPILIAQVGKWDVRKVIERGEKETFLKFVNHMFSQLIKLCEEQSQLPDKVVSQVVGIVDMQGFEMRQITLMGAVDAMLEAARRFEANFPETLKQGFVINAPRIFPILFAMVKPILSANTVNKIQIFGPNTKKWKPALKNYFPADQYPQHYGGTKVMDPKSRIGFHSLSPQNSLNSTQDGEEFISVTVAAGDIFELDFDITSPLTTTLTWKFKTDDYDIGFWIKRDEEKIREMEKCQSHVDTQEGSLVCEQTGKYTLLFDNSYSRLRSKSLHYIVSMVLNSGDEEDDWEECTSL
jgi:hypothetical protein